MSSAPAPSIPAAISASNPLFVPVAGSSSATVAVGVNGAGCVGGTLGCDGGTGAVPIDTVGGCVVSTTVVTGGSVVGGCVVTGGSVVGGCVVTGGSVVGGTVVTGGSVVGGTVVTGGSVVGGTVVVGAHSPVVIGAPGMTT